jgi:hypothetical protein
MFSIFTARYDSQTNSWGTPELLSNVDNDAISPKIASGASNGDMVAAWLQSDEVVYYVYASLYSAGGASPGWAQGVPISNINVGYDGNIINVTMDREGNAIVVWEVFGEGTSIWANIYDAASGEWLGEKEISTYGNEPQVAFDPFGNAIIVWEEIEAGIYATRYEKGTDWDSWDPINFKKEISSESGAENPKLVIDSVGNAIVVWQQYPDGNEIAFKRYRFGSESFAWDYEGGDVLYSSSDTLDDLSIGIGPTGKAIASWVRVYYDGETTYYVVNAIVFE